MDAKAQTPKTMTAIAVTRPGGPDVLVPETRAVPVPKPGEVLIRVAAAGVNRPDLLQRLGKYPPPPGAPDIPGLEIAGTIVAAGPNTTPPYPIGARVAALLSGGGYADYACAPVGQILPLPDSVSDLDAAALPEGLFTIWQNIFQIGALRPHESVLIHGGASGIGTTAIQMVRYAGTQNKIFVTAGNDEKCAACLKLGADHAINYKTDDFVAAVMTATNGAGVDLVLDMVGGDYVPRNLACLKDEGRHISIAVQGGAGAEIDLRVVMTRRLILTGSTLRPRTAAEKEILRDDLLRHVWPGVITGQIKPMIHAVFDLQGAAAAHTALEQGHHIGKIVLRVGG